MFCRKCGTNNPPINKFCGECGALLPRLHFASETVPEGTARQDLLRTEALHTTSVPVRHVGQSEFGEPIQRELLRDEVLRDEPFTEEPVHEEPLRDTPVRAREHYTPISGPSLLGLNDDETDTSSTYLLDEENEDEGRRSRAGWYIFSFIAIAILAAFVVLEWQTIKTGKIAVPWFSSTTAEPPKSTDHAATESAPSAGKTPESGFIPPAVPPPAADQPLTGDETLTGPPASVGKSITPAEPTAPAAAKPELPPADAAARGSSEKDPNDTAAESAVAAAKAPKPKTEAPEGKPSTPKQEEAAEPIAATKPAPKPDPRQNRMLVAGERYLYGRGVPRDCNQAVIYFRAAADEDNVAAMSRLGAMYASGNCVRLDRRTAYSWFARAQESDPGNQWISRNLNMLWRDMSAEERAAIAH